MSFITYLLTIVHPAHPLTVIGLGIELFGVFGIFIWGPPQPDFQPYTLIRTQDDADPAVIRNKRRHEVRSRIGLALIAIGIGLQLFEAWNTSN